MKGRILCFVIVVCSFLVAHADGADSLALTPPMGWNSWNCFSCDVNERQIREMADVMRMGILWLIRCVSLPV